jgi:putative chitinase
MDYPGSVIKLGDTGDAVKAIQARLNVEQTGTFGPTTEGEVKAFQASHGIEQTGEVGQQTWDAMFPSQVITAAQWKQVTPSIPDTKLTLYLPFMNAAMIQFGISSPQRAAAWIAQTSEESDQWHTLTEYASGAEYEGRRDLGNTEPGDGKRFKGRGPIQVTGRTNYTEVSAALGADFVSEPDLLAEPEYAFKGSAWWWTQHGLNHLADINTAASFISITRVINGGTNGLTTRQLFWARAKTAYGI